MLFFLICTMLCFWDKCRGYWGHPTVVFSGTLFIYILYAILKCSGYCKARLSCQADVVLMTFKPLSFEAAPNRHKGEPESGFPTHVHDLP